jgi:hypothetical protein
VAACLLRSYEILKGISSWVSPAWTFSDFMTADSRQEQRHLLGAYRFSSTEEIDMSTTGLLQAGAWNCLREEITVALECQRPVRLNIHLDVRSTIHQSESMHANTITYILARVINHCFSMAMERLVYSTVISGRNCTMSSCCGMVVYHLPILRTREQREQETPSHLNGFYDHGTVNWML